MLWFIVMKETEQKQKKKNRRKIKHRKCITSEKCMEWNGEWTIKQ